MNNHGKLKKYSELFRKYISEYLAPGIQVTAIMHPVVGPGAVFEFLLDASSNKDKITPEEKSVGAVLNNIEQKFIGGDNLEGIQFRGTNIMLSNNRILIVKGEDGESFWNARGVRDDLMRVVSSSRGGGRS